LVFLVMLAYSYNKASSLKDRKKWAATVGSGGLLSGIVLSASSILAAGPWVGIVVGILIAGLTRSQMKPGSESREFFRKQVGSLIHQFRMRKNWTTRKEQLLEATWKRSGP